MRTSIDKLVTPIILTLQDQSSTAKREIALRALGKLTSNTGYVIQPFIDYRLLMDILLTEIESESNKLLRIEVRQTLGIIGGLDPYPYTMSQWKLKRIRKIEGPSPGSSTSTRT